MLVQADVAKGAEPEVDVDVVTLSHDQVVHARDRATGLRAIVAIHDTTLGPALGGTRFYPYIDERRALQDVLRLSQGMTHKAALAGLPLGGGKAVILGDPAQLKTRDLLRAYGHLVESLGGRYITAADVGTTSADMDVVGETTRHVVARTPRAGGSGDSAPLTAYGTFYAMRAAAQHVWGTPTLAGRTIGVEGLGKVGYELVALLLADGAAVVASDISTAATTRADHWTDLRIVDDVTRENIEVYAPCAMGGTVTAPLVDSLSAAIICGAANNQMAHPNVEESIRRRGITWVPDYVANAGGLIQVAGERERLDRDTVTRQVGRIGDTVQELLAGAQRDGICAGAAADAMVAGRLVAARRAQRA